MTLSFLAADGAEVGAGQLIATSYVLTIPRGTSTIANHLNRGGNTLAEVLPGVPEGTLLYKYDDSRTSYTLNRYQFGIWSRPTETLAPGEGAFIRNPGNEFSVTFAGTKPSSQFPPLYRAMDRGGLNFTSLPVPGETSLPTPFDGDSIAQVQSSSSLSWYISTFDGLDKTWHPLLPPLDVGESFFYSSRNPNLPVAPIRPEAGGTVYFATSVPGVGVPGPGAVVDVWHGVDARVTFSDGRGVGEGFTGQLYWGPAGTPVDQLLPLTPKTTFQSRTSDVRGYVQPVLVTPPGIDPGMPATLVLRVFDGTTFESSSIRGESKPITIAVGGGLNLPANLVGLQAFSLSEPGTSQLIEVRRAADGLTLSYTGTLQSAADVTGPYADVPGATSPAVIKFNGPATFYRLKR